MLIRLNHQIYIQDSSFQHYFGINSSFHNTNKRIIHNALLHWFGFDLGAVITVIIQYVGVLPFNHLM